MKIPAYWCNIDNFGDALNPVIFKKLAGITLHHKNLEQSFIIGIGSLLENLLSDNKNDKFCLTPINVFSTGFGFEEGGFFHNKNIILPEKLKRNVKCYALRGKLTKSRIEKQQKVPDDCVIADGGLLCGYLVEKEKIKPIYRLGIVPHFADKESSIFKQILANIPNSVILDPTENVYDFLKHLCQCECVISTAMHPLIACDALNIPNKWVRISDKTTSLYKFHDYYSAFDTDCEPLYLNDYVFTENDINDIIKNRVVPFDKVQKKQQELLSALKRLKKDMKALKMNLTFLAVKKFIINLACIFVPSKKIRHSIKQAVLKPVMQYI